MAIEKPFAVLPLTLTGIATGNERSNRPASHLALPQYSGMRWQSEGNGNLWVRGQFDGTSRAVNFMSMMAANASLGTTIRLRLGATQAQVDGAAPYDSGALPFILLVPGSPLFSELFEGGLFDGDEPAPAIRADGRYHSHLELPSTVNASWWRIDIGGHTGDFSASALIMGTKRTPAHFYNRDRELGYEDLGSVDISRNGIVAETPGVVLKTMLFRLGWVSEAEYFDTWAPLFTIKGKRQVVFFCFDPDATVRRQDKTLIGYLARDIFMRGGTAPQTNEMDFQFRGLM